jgi:voltage-gated potassium channel
VRDGTMHRYFESVVSQLSRGDRLIVVRPSEQLAEAPRPGTDGEDEATEQD